MTTLLPASPAPEAILVAGRGAGRVTALAVVACVAVHGTDAVQHWSMSPVSSTATLVVAAGCLLCVPALWTNPSTRSLVHAALGFAAMMALHLMMMPNTASTSGFTNTHAHSGPMPTTAPMADVPSVHLAVVAMVLPMVGLLIIWLMVGRTRPTDSSTRKSRSGCRSRCG